MRIVSRKLRKFLESTDHTTYRNNDGDVVPSVTTILKVISKENLIYWANNLGWQRKSVKTELDNSSEIGTLAHNFIEAILLNDDTNQKLLRIKIQNLPKYLRDPIINSVISFKAWWNDNKDNFEIISCETEMACDTYGGTADIIALYQGNLVILDLKTSKSFYYSMFLQLAAYVKMYKKMFKKEPKDAAILKLDKYNGNIAKILWISELPGDLDFYYQSFKKALELFTNIHILEKDWEAIKR